MRFGDQRGSWEVVDLPGSPQVAVSIHSFIFPDKRGTGHGSQMHTERLQKFVELGYDYVLCTVRTANVAEVKILKKNGWTQLDMFSSSSTGSEVAIYGKKLRESVS